MALEWEQTVIDANDPAMLGRWWQQVLGWVVIDDDPRWYEIRPAVDRFPGLIFVPVQEPKTTKNRLHIDLRPDDQDAEVSRLIAMGATTVDIGQGEDVYWTVLADPERNEFCVLSSRRTP